MSIEIEPAELCTLAASGFATSHLSVSEWLEKVMIQVKATFADGPVNADLWAYRVDGDTFFACDLWQENKRESVGITFLPGLSPDLSDVLEPQVLDMADALHMAGMLVRSIKATVTVGRENRDRPTPATGTEQ